MDRGQPQTASPPIILFEIVVKTKATARFERLQTEPSNRFGHFGVPKLEESIPKESASDGNMGSLSITQPQAAWYFDIRHSLMPANQI
jgi:hypothetical protein